MQLLASSLVALVAFTGALQGAYGSYVPTCRNEYVQGKTLHAQCKNRSGQYVDTTLDLDNCAANYGGQLACVHGR